MKKLYIFITTLLSVILLALSCNRDVIDWKIPADKALPPGIPTLLTIPFGTNDPYEVTVGTKAESPGTDETAIHDLYVFLFDNDDQSTGSPRKIYGRYFSYEHLEESLSDLNSIDHEGWYVSNKNVSGTVATTRGAVKISTVTKEHAILVVLANVSNAVMELDGSDEISRLNSIEDYDELRGLKVKLEQDVVNRKDLFLKLGVFPESGTVNTGNMHWNTVDDPEEYDPDYRVTLSNIDAKVKFRINVNTTNISNVTPVYWEVCNVPNSCYLFSDYNSGAAPDDIIYFNSQKAYFEAEKDGYYEFCFYMLENRLSPIKSATKFHQREQRRKIIQSDSGYDIDASAPGYSGSYDTSFTDHYAKDGDWEYANPYSTYVRFDMILTLTSDGIDDIGSADPQGMTIGQALTSDAIFTVHLGDFTSSAKGDGWSGFNDYNTERSTYYTYNVTVNNTKSIFTEVNSDNEVQPGEEGYLLLADSEIINADAHYEYQTMTFTYRPGITQDKFSWFVKTPFGEGGPDIIHDPLTGEYSYHLSKQLDYLWVKFGLNKEYNGEYKEERTAYPGDSTYHPEWVPGQTVTDIDPATGNESAPKNVPDLMDITQLIQFIFWQTDIETNHPGQSLFRNGNIRVTAFIDEYYYTENPITHTTDPDLWRLFVGAQPREMHILSDAHSSRDLNSDVIFTSHSIIQESIQTIYNKYSSNLRTLWGCEHKDEMKERHPDGFPYWPYAQGNGSGSDGRTGAFNDLGKENGRLNSAYIWGTYSRNDANGKDINTLEWNSFINYEVQNTVPELIPDYYGMAWSCLTRNRDNNGNGKIERNEIRWYMAAANQIAGMWVGNDALSISARLYQPASGQWRAHILTSTDKRTCWAEEGAGATPYTWDFESGRYTWNSITEASKGETVRCVRNIGTYDNNGSVEDITYAPYKQEIDKYFTLSDNGDNSYTFHFDRLDPKAMRQLSEGELPFHDQFSPFNKVYLEMTTQSRDDDIPSYTSKLVSINDTVSRAGYNQYCPPGYRFPNQTEMLLMSLYLPVEYMTRDASGTAYSPHVYMPTRTYFDRGFFGSKRNDPGSKPTEQWKIGWAYYTSDKRQHCMKGDNAPSRSRCVRDVNCTGLIEGGINIGGATELYPGNPTKIGFKFFSSGSAFINASLKLCYTNHNGSYREIDIPLAKPISGLQYSEDQVYTFPTLGSLGLVAADLDTDRKNMKFKIDIYNTTSNGVPTSFEVPFILASHLTDCSMTFPDVSDSDRGMPVRIHIGSVSIYSKLSNVTLHWKAKGESSYNEKILLGDGSDLGSGLFNVYNGDVYTRDLIGDAYNNIADFEKEYIYYVTASCDDGTSWTSSKMSMQLFDLNQDSSHTTPSLTIDPNPAPEGGWPSTTTVSDIDGTWIKHITGLDFEHGDRLEIGINLTYCNYIYKDGNKDHDIGLDNILAVGKTDNISSMSGNTPLILFYYPSIEHQVSDPAAQGNSNLRFHAGKWQAQNIPNIRNIEELLFVFDKDGFITNGIRYTSSTGDWNNSVKAALTSSTELYIGSEEGIHHSRASYDYVRIIRTTIND